MIWLLLPCLLIGLGLFPLLRERLRRPMGSGARNAAPGSFARLSRGLTHYQWHGPARGPIAVCVHGLTTPSFVWGGLADGLVAKGYRVLTYDLYGRGFSDRPAGEQDRSFFIHQLEELLEHEGVTGDFTLVGYSMGGAIATTYASAHSDQIRELVLLASAGLKTNPGKIGLFIRDHPHLGNWLMLALFPRMHRRGCEAERPLPTSVPGIIDLQKNELHYRGYIPAVLASLRGILSEDLSDDLRHIHRQGVPLLAIWGGTDEVIPVSSIGRMTEQARSARQEVVEGAGHGLPYTHTEEVLDLIATNHRQGLQ
ncbi:alpha/beta hydrolase [Pseudophaeobacter sp.]|uniref:alpha/beta fold hydrolase n=1 Tax=Pseudophaeobacter sp. TaxID=1971739 RepID=UPI003297F05A